MILKLAFTFYALLGAATAAQIRGLQSEDGCIGSSVGQDVPIFPDTFLCDPVVDGSQIRFGIATEANGGSTIYKVVKRIVSGGGTTDTEYANFETSGEAPYLLLQGDGHLLFNNGGFSMCLAEPGKGGGKLRIESGRVEITDIDGKILWDPERSGCYPKDDTDCRPAFYKNEFGTKGQFLCTHDENGNVKYKFGLDEKDDGLFGLWKGGELVWRPAGGPIRGDRFYLQEDGHLVVYIGSGPDKQVVWSSNGCINWYVRKMVISSDGDVQVVAENGSIIWVLPGSEIPTPFMGNPVNSVAALCMPLASCVVPPETPPFFIDNVVDIGPSTATPVASKCGIYCYEMEDNGAPLNGGVVTGDSLRFAYKEVTADYFLFQAKVCCKGCEGTFSDGPFHNIGIMVRESLEPDSRMVYLSHQPYNQGGWGSRGGQGIGESSGSYDVDCLMFSIRRDWNAFIVSLSYLDTINEQCSVPERYRPEDERFSFDDVPDKVLVGLMVSNNGIWDTEAGPRDTVATFSEIQLSIGNQYR